MIIGSLKCIKFPSKYFWIFYNLEKLEFIFLLKPSSSEWKDLKNIVHWLLWPWPWCLISQTGTSNELFSARCTMYNLSLPPKEVLLKQREVRRCQIQWGITIQLISCLWFYHYLFLYVQQSWNPAFQEPEMRLKEFISIRFSKKLAINFFLH